MRISRFAIAAGAALTAVGTLTAAGVGSVPAVAAPGMAAVSVPTAVRAAPAAMANLLILM